MKEDRVDKENGEQSSSSTSQSQQGGQGGKRKRRKKSSVKRRGSQNQNNQNSHGKPAFQQEETAVFTLEDVEVSSSVWCVMLITDVDRPSRVKLL